MERKSIFHLTDHTDFPPYRKLSKVGGIKRRYSEQIEENFMESGKHLVENGKNMSEKTTVPSIVYITKTEIASTIKLAKRKSWLHQ